MNEQDCSFLHILSETLLWSPGRQKFWCPWQCGVWAWFSAEVNFEEVPVLDSSGFSIDTVVKAWQDGSYDGLFAFSQVNTLSLIESYPVAINSLFSRELHLELTSAYSSTWADCLSHSSDPDHPFLLSIFSLSDCWEDCVIVSSWGLQSLWRDLLLAAPPIKKIGKQ